MNNTVENRNICRRSAAVRERENLFGLLYAFCEKAVAFSERKSVDTVMRIISGIASLIGGYLYIINVVNGNLGFLQAVVYAVVLILTGGFTIRCRMN